MGMFGGKSILSLIDTCKSMCYLENNNYYEC